MKQTSLIFYFGLLVTSLVLAFFTWTGEPKISKNKVSILNCGKGDFLGLSFKTPDRSVEFSAERSRRSGKPFWWVEIVRPPAPVPGDNAEGEIPEKDLPSEKAARITAFKGNQRLHDKFEKFCSWERSGQIPNASFLRI